MDGLARATPNGRQMVLRDETRPHVSIATHGMPELTGSSTKNARIHRRKEGLHLAREICQTE